MSDSSRSLWHGGPSDLVSLTSDNASSADLASIVDALQQRFRADLPYTRLSSTTLVVVNPLKSLASASEASAEDYRQRTNADFTWEQQGKQSSETVLPPHPYELAGKVYHMMRRTGQSQAVIFGGTSGSGKTSTSQLFSSQLLRLSSSSSKKEHKLAEQLRSLDILLNSFGCAQTTANSNASRFSRYLELHFDNRARLGAVKLLTFGLDKSRVNTLASGERTFHVFYQLLTGATSEERQLFKLEDVTAYRLLASSGCYRLASGPSTDDSIGLNALRAAMKTLGFKQKHCQAIFSFLSAILLLGNLEFTDLGGSGDFQLGSEAAWITNPEVLEDVAGLLGVPAGDLSQSLTHRSRFVSQQIITTVLDSNAARAQKDGFMRDLYATLFSFVAETANHKLAPSSEDTFPTQIVQFDCPGHQTLAESSESFAQFTINSIDDCLRNWLDRLEFDDHIGVNASLAQDGIDLPQVQQNRDSNGCIEMLRGGLVGSNATDREPGGLFGILRTTFDEVGTGAASQDDDAALLKKMDTLAPFNSFYVPTSKVLREPDAPLAFGINHCPGLATYKIDGFVAREIDAADTTFLQMLRRSQVPFISRLFAGPSLATESLPYDPITVVRGQVSSRPLRQPSSLAGQPSTAPFLDPLRPYGVTQQLNASLSEVLGATCQAGQVWRVMCLRPNGISQPGSLDFRCLQSQVDSLAMPALVVRNRIKYIRGLSHADFCERYQGLVDPAAAAVGGLIEAKDKIQAFVIANGWRETTDYAMGDANIWLTYSTWRRMEDRLRRSDTADPSPILKPAPYFTREHEACHLSVTSCPPGVDRSQSPLKSTSNSAHQSELTSGSEANSLLPRHASHAALENPFSNPNYATSGEISPGTANTSAYSNAWEYKRAYGDIDHIFAEEADKGFAGAIDAIEEIPTTSIRRWWVRFTWLCTWFIPSFLLSKWGGMKRPDVQMAWREKLTICTMIFLLCGTILFYILVFGKLLCPHADEAWDPTELAAHDGTDSYYVAIAGNVYDLTKFYKRQHSDTITQVTESVMLVLGGADLTPYFPVPMTLACPSLVTSEAFALDTNDNLTATYTQAVHTSGTLQTDSSSALYSPTWYTNTLRPFLTQYRKGYYVYSIGHISEEANWRNWAIVDSKVYDLTNYLDTVATATSGALNNQNVNFLSSNLVDLFDQSPGTDVTSEFNRAISSMNDTYRSQNLACLNNAFYVGQVDFRDTPRCLVQNYLLLAFSVILVATILSKFVAALQLTTKRNPEQQNKFVICQITCYTEGEEELRKTIDSVAVQQYDDKRKLIFIVCDGMIVGRGNELPTPRIVLDILGVEGKVDPEPLMFKSIAEGSKQLNYGKVHSGLYECNGHIVPFIVVVKCGRPTERVRPGNRGKRDTQILMMRYLNRVHFDAPMYPLELEIYHQMKNVIGIDPSFYEYVLMVDADTTVEADGLNRLVAAAADDSRIIAICGETTIDNEEGSWWTMIQVYEYYISHHLSKAFESLFGSVTCLPGCFSMYRIRSADKGRPMFISNRIIDEYSENRVDTLHKKNLLSLGEDRYLTTLILKHFPTFRTKFAPDARAHTAAPDRFSVLLSQRRRWINSTIHNLAELMLMPELCGFCLFSMRFIVFIDLLGTLILPATVVYLVYLIITVSTGKGAFPLISVVMIAAVYGLQMIIFLVKRQWQYIGWMIIYLLAFPIYSFFLPVYSFWHMDDFSWGNTRIVVGEKGNKKIIAGTDDEPYDDSMIPLKRYSDYQREVWNRGLVLGSERGDADSFDFVRQQPSAFYAPESNGSTLFRGEDSRRIPSPRGHDESGRGLRNSRDLINFANSPLHAPSRLGSGNAFRSPSRAGSIAGASERASSDYFKSTNVLERPRYSRSSSYAFNDGLRSVSQSRLPSLSGPVSPQTSQFNLLGQGAALPRAAGSHMSMGPGNTMPSMPHMLSMYGMPSHSFGVQYPSMYGFPGSSSSIAFPPCVGVSGSAVDKVASPSSHSMDILNRPLSSMAIGTQFTDGGTIFDSRRSNMNAGVVVPNTTINPFPSTHNTASFSTTADSDNGNDQVGSSTGLLPPNSSENPTEEELKSAIITFLAAQTDLFSVTKRTVRTAVERSFTKVDLKGDKVKLNRLIDDVLEGRP